MGGALSVVSDPYDGVEVEGRGRTEEVSTTGSDLGVPEEEEKTEEEYETDGTGGASGTGAHLGDEQVGRLTSIPLSDPAGRCDPFRESGGRCFCRGWAGRSSCSF